LGSAIATSSNDCLVLVADRALVERALDAVVGLLTPPRSSRPYAPLPVREHSTSVTGGPPVRARRRMAEVNRQRTANERGAFSGGFRRVARPFHAQALYLPLAVIGAASLALQPSLGLPAHVASEEIAAGEGALGIRRGERRDVAASAGVWVLPSDVIPVASGERGGSNCARISKVDLRRLRVVLRPYVRAALRSERIELIGASAGTGPAPTSPSAATAITAAKRR
jgi:hypothetical protein